MSRRHIMLSYQWDDQALVLKVYQRLREDGLPVWMDVQEGGVTGNINDAMAAAVESAAVVCPFMTAAYQTSRSCKKELNYADSREVTVVPVMLAQDWEASEWLGLITAGLLWVDFRDVLKDEQHFEECVRSLEEEILFNVGHLLTQDDQAETPKVHLKKKPGRAFCHALSRLHIHDAGERLESVCETGSPVELNEALAAACYWEEIKGSGFKRYRNVVTKRYLGYDPERDEVRSEVGPSEREEWLLLVEPTERSRHGAVVLKNKHSGRFLAVRQGHFLALSAYDDKCKWFLQ
ncbi:uncharacterized protein [Nerophis lumbriciformis]|uniref:uncharacterized protein n=1 Tax=Nerophis lumbriciformis TaxID=546530 RepID=UPI002AE06401|nr:uncharacterized protein LOC133621776 [Nerophis lumbriciformis]